MPTVTDSSEIRRSPASPWMAPDAETSMCLRALLTTRYSTARSAGTLKRNANKSEQPLTLCPTASRQRLAVWRRSWSEHERRLRACKINAQDDGLGEGFFRMDVRVEFGLPWMSGTNSGCMQHMPSSTALQYACGASVAALSRTMSFWWLGRIQVSEALSSSSCSRSSGTCRSFETESHTLAPFCFPCLGWGPARAELDPPGKARHARSNFMKPASSLQFSGPVLGREIGGIPVKWWRPDGQSSRSLDGLWAAGCELDLDLASKGGAGPAGPAVPGLGSFFRMLRLHLSPRAWLALHAAPGQGGERQLHRTASESPEVFRNLAVSRNPPGTALAFA